MKMDLAVQQGPPNKWTRVDGLYRQHLGEPYRYNHYKQLTTQVYFHTIGKIGSNT